MQTAVYIDHMAYVLKVSSRTTINTFGDILYLYVDGHAEFIFSAFAGRYTHL